MSSEITDLYISGKTHYEKGEMKDALACFEELFKKSSGLPMREILPVSYIMTGVNMIRL